MSTGLQNAALPRHVSPFFGGVVIAVVGLHYSRGLGSGYDVIGSIASRTLEVTLPLTLALLLMKIVATSITLNSGGSGGLFVPSIFVGTMLGLSYYLSLNTAWRLQLR